MRNFDYQTPTRLIFGEGVVEKLPEVMKPLGRKILLTYGGGSIKKIGLYDRVKELLKEFEVFELSGIEPNPKYSTSVLDGVRLCKENDIDVILAVGGGSVLDCSKAIAAGAKYEGETWDLISYQAFAKEALPIVDILTLAATGSEYDCGGVISRTETNDKIGYMDPHLFPVCSILDPCYTFTVSKKQTAAGCADAMNHVMEQYFTEDTTLLNDGFCEAELKSLMYNTRIALENPEDYRAYVNVMPDLFDLYDVIEMEFADAYNAGGGRYGRKKYAGYKDGKIVAKSKFGLNDLQYKVPDGLLYPAVAAFRSLLVMNETTGKYEWKNGVGPIEVWDRCKIDLTNKIMNFAASIGDNPNAVGKDSNVWDLAYMTIKLRNVE